MYQSPEDKEQARLEQIEEQNRRHDEKAFRDFEVLDIKDEYFDEETEKERLTRMFKNYLERHHGNATEFKKAVMKIVTEVLSE